MLDQKQRAAILALHEQGHGIRAIARALKISRRAARAVVVRGCESVPTMAREQVAERWREEILSQHVLCKGNLVRVHEEIRAQGAEVSYQALTAFCRRHGIGHEPKQPSGRYHFEPAQEMQHDTSPHEAEIGGVLRRVQTASLVLCHSRMIFIQLYPTFTRFDCKVFLTTALGYFGGAAQTCMIDNTHVVVLKGTGAKMVPVPEMAAFGERYGFTFKAHEVGDANRSARVEGPFDWVDKNFLAGRKFRDWLHANQEAKTWCDKKNAAFSSKLHASRRQLFAAEAPQLVPLPIWVPEVYLLHHRIVDTEGYVNVRHNRYSVPFPLIGRQMEVRETQDKIEVFDGPRCVAVHQRVYDARDAWVTLREHRPPRGQGKPKDTPGPEEEALLKVEPSLADYVAALKTHATGRGTVAFRRLLRLLRDHPREPFLVAVRSALQYGLFDLDRLERMVLKQIASDYFVLPDLPEPEADTPDGGDPESDDDE
jgi:transposase